MNKKEIYLIFARYFSLIILGISNLFIFYFIFTPLTFYPSYWLIHLIYGASISQSAATQVCSSITSLTFFPELFSNIACIDTTIFFKGYYASIIPACIAGAAYYLLTILNLTTPMPQKTRIKSFLFVLTSFLILNILRITLFAVLFVEKGYAFFDAAHIAAWYFGSTALIAVIWFANITIFKIKAIPVYTDLKNLFSSIAKKRQRWRL